MGKTVITVDLGGNRRHLGIGELPYRLADKLLFISQLEVHGASISLISTFTAR